MKINDEIMKRKHFVDEHLLPLLKSLEMNITDAQFECDINSGMCWVTVIDIRSYSKKIGVKGDGTLRDMAIDVLMEI